MSGRCQPPVMPEQYGGTVVSTEVRLAVSQVVVDRRRGVMVPPGCAWRALAKTALPNRGCQPIQSPAPRTEFMALTRLAITRPLAILMLILSIVLMGAVSYTR